MASITGNLDNPLILAIETSGRLGSVRSPKATSSSPRAASPVQMRHSAEIFPAITDLLSKFSKKPDQIEQVYISVGPGSFTGLRIAVTLAKTYWPRQLARTPIGEVSPAELNSARRTKIVAVDTLDCIAANVLSKSDESDRSDWSDRLAVILDAKRGQFFIAVYEKTQDPQTQDPRPQSGKRFLPDCLMTAEEFLDRFSESNRLP